MAFGFLKRNKSIDTINGVRVEKNGGKYFYALNGIGQLRTIRDTATTDGQRSAYQFCPVVTSIVTKKVSAAENGKRYYTDSAGKVIEGAKVNDLEKLLSTLDHAKAYTMNQVFGKAYIQKVTSLGFESLGITRLDVLNGWNVKDDVTKTYIEYKDENTNYTQHIERDQLIIWNDTYFNFAGRTEPVIGGSRLVSLKDAVSNIAAAFEGENMIWTNGGAVGMLTPQAQAMGSVPLTPEQKDELTNHFATRYGLQRGKSPVIVTDQPHRWQSTILPISQLMYIEGIADNARQVCDCYGVSPMLLGFASGTTFNNKSEAERAMYQDAVVPEMERLYVAINKDKSIAKNGIYAAIDFAHLSVLQDDDKTKADALKANIDANGKLYSDGLITLNQYLTRLDLPVVPNGDKYISEITMQPLAVRIGVGGTQSLQAILVDANMTDDQKLNTLIVLFGLTEQEARQIMGGK